MSLSRKYTLRKPFVLALVAVAVIVICSNLLHDTELLEQNATSTDLERSASAILDRDIVLQPLSADDLLRYRRENKHLIQQPTDSAKAAEVLNETEILWAELQEFMHEPEFRRQRFAENSPYAGWKRRADALHQNKPPPEVIGGDVFAVPGWLIAVANDYAGSPHQPGRTSEVERWLVGCHLPLAREAVYHSSNPKPGEQVEQ